MASVFYEISCEFQKVNSLHKRGTTEALAFLFHYKLVELHRLFLKSLVIWHWGYTPVVWYSSSQQSGNWLMVTVSFPVKLLHMSKYKNSLIKLHLLSWLVGKCPAVTCTVQSFSSLKGFNLLEGNFHLLALPTLPLPQLDPVLFFQKTIAHFLLYANQLAFQGRAAAW